MKNIKYLLLLVLLLPIRAFAEPIHLTQAAIEECFANQGVYNETYKMKFMLEEYVSGFFLYGDEYTLDEDLKLHKAHLTTENNSVTINLNGHVLTSLLDKYSPVPGYLTPTTPVGCSLEGCEMTFNGPGKIDPSVENYGNAVLNESGKITFNNLEIVGNIKASDYSPNADLGLEYVLNNVELSGRFEVWSSKITIDGGRFNYGRDYAENQIIGSTAIIKNTSLGALKSYGLYIRDEDPNSIYGNNNISNVTIDNCNITGSSAVIMMSSTGTLTIENSELWASDQPGIGYNALYISQPAAQIQMADVHIHTDRTDWPYPTIYSKGPFTTEPEEYFNSLVKPGYIYWKDPVFEREDHAATQYQSAYTMYKVSNTDIWIIKQNQDYDVDNEPVYIIPNENEIILSIPGEVDLLEGVEVDDDELDDNQYTAEEDEDNVNIKLEDSYLQTLDEGEYTIKVLFANGEATTTLVVTNEDPNTIVEPTSAEVKGEEETNPNTGLKNHMLLLIPIIVGGIAFYCVSKKSFFKI